MKTSKKEQCPNCTYNLEGVDIEYIDGDIDWEYLEKICPNCGSVCHVIQSIVRTFSHVEIVKE